MNKTAVNVHAEEMRRRRLMINDDNGLDHIDIS